MTDHSDKLHQDMKYIETKFQILAGIHFNNANNYKMLISGVMLGLLGGLFASIFYILIIEPLSQMYQYIFLIIIGGAFVYLIKKFSNEMKSERKKALQVKQERDKVFNLIDSLKSNLKKGNV